MSIASRRREARKRWYVIRFNQRRYTKCSNCGEVMVPGEHCWSPYYGGGQYHLGCEATPHCPPSHGPPDERLRCPGCGWFRRELVSTECSRCAWMNGRTFAMKVER